MPTKGICTISLVPLRAEPDDRAEMVSQILFGESFDILQTHKQWMQVRLDWDGYTGWIDNKQALPVEESFLREAAGETGISLELAQTIISHDRKFPIVFGSSLPMFDGMNFRIGKDKYVFNGQAHNPAHNHIDPPSLLSRVARKFVNSPYLWGGRSPFGIDCSGLVQVLYKAIGLALPRDSYLQAQEGTAVDFTNETTVGDLAFFENSKGEIAHVGMLLEDRHIIHAYGQVRIDRLDHFGIYNQKEGKYTHKLRILKRFF